MPSYASVQAQLLVVAQLSQQAMLSLQQVSFISSVLP
jgi:hypothetical protein